MKQSKWTKWRPVKKTSGFKHCDYTWDGRVRNRKTGHVYEGFNQDGYLIILGKTKANGERDSITAHVLIGCEELGHVRYSGYEVHHIDENPRNNRLSNLVNLTKEEHDLISGKNRGRKKGVPNTPIEIRMSAVKRYYESQKNPNREARLTYMAVAKMHHVTKMTFYNWKKAYDLQKEVDALVTATTPEFVEA